MNKISASVYSESFARQARELEGIIGYSFKEPLYLYNALTHSSYSNECRAQKKTAYSNERLEFLGDSVLSITVSSHIYNSLSDQQEGDLTKIRAFAVCEDALYQFASKIELGKYLALGRGEEKTDGRHRKSILADATEALIAAIYLDSGHSLEAVEPLIMKIALPRIDEMISTIRSGGSKNYKGALQQLVQNSKGDILEYEEVSESGPDHNKTFTIRVKLNSNSIGTGSGRSKQEAEQAAAKEALKLFGEKV
ncbi:MAG: ribonuclease III [Clostridia bacterium]|nr:ribonuclease III [Clostridia bacterium]